MNFASRINRTSLPYNAELGGETAALFPEFAPELQELVLGAAGSSPYLRGLLTKNQDWAKDAFQEQPEHAFAKIIQESQSANGEQLPRVLRQSKAKVALLTALADLGGVWSLEEVTKALSEFADCAADRAIRCCVNAEIRRGKLVDIGRDAGGIVAIAMGKMGAKELNYSSDIDLIMLFDGAAYGENVQEARASLVRATRRASGMLSDNTSDGYVFRTDLRLRPDPAVTPVCLSVEAAEAYYESVGRTWERAAYIKARPAAGDLHVGREFLQRLTPFVWRKHLDFAAIQDAHDMQLRIREHKGLSGAITLPGHNMKLGRGGIREIEFFTQTQQLISGGRDPDLRVKETKVALQVLADKNWVPQDKADVLSKAYSDHRMVEHRLQMIHDAQTHSLPNDEAGFDRVAALMGREAGELRVELQERLETVHALTDAFFAPVDPTIAPPDLPADLLESVEIWHSYPALRSARAAEIFERLKPDLIRRLNAARKPKEAVEQFGAFLSGLPAGVQLFSMFEANPHLIDLIVDISATAPGLARYLSRNAQVFDAVIGGDFFADWPGEIALKAELSAQLGKLDDYERQLDAARRWHKEWHFRIGVHHLRGVMEAEQVGRAYADLATATTAGLWPIVAQEFARKYGQAPGHGAVVLGMGSLGAGQLSSTSDLDLIVIYDADGQEESAGPRSLPSRSYYARLTQAFVTSLSAQTAEGTLYEVDMRLRPSGRKGPVATSLESFRIYQREEAWTWEHLALTRAKPIAGNEALAVLVEQERLAILGESRDPKTVAADVTDMRKRLAEVHDNAELWMPKRGAGRMQDIELLAQTACLLYGAGERDTLEQLSLGERAGWLSAKEVDQLSQAHRWFWTLQAALRLLTAGRIEPQDLGETGRAFLLRQTGLENIDALEAQVSRNTQIAAEHVASALERLAKT